MIRFSVIIPSFNRLTMLKECVASIPEESGVEIIIVDDGSTDGTYDWVMTNPRLRLVTQANAGPGAARNNGAAIATGNHLAFLDSDDLWFPWTPAVYREIIDRTGAEFIAGRPRFFEQPEELAHETNAEVSHLEFTDYLRAGNEWRWWGCSSFVISAKAFRKAGGFCATHMNGEDADLALRLGTSKGFVQIKQPYTFGYRRNPEGETFNHARTTTGALHMLRCETSTGYPGGRPRAHERARIISRHLRPVALSCLRTGDRASAWSIYRGLFRSHVYLGRWRFLIGFPIIACFRPRQIKSSI